MAAKHCSKCGALKEADQYSPDRRAKDGLQSSCRECSARRHSEKYHADPAAARARQRNYVSLNKEAVYAINNKSRVKNNNKIRARKKASYESQKDNPEFKAKRRAQTKRGSKRKAAYDREYRAQNRERLVEKAANWSAANPLKRRTICHSYDARRRANKSGGDSTAAITKWAKNTKKTCFWCGRKRLRDYHVDHFVPLSRGGKHEIRNLVIACGPCNIRKSATMPGRFCIQPRPGMPYDLRPTRIIRRSVLRRTKPNETYGFAF